MILIASGSELCLAVEAYGKLVAEGIRARVVSMPSWEIFVSYDGKHNEANGEHGRDGADDNRSWNCGAEGPTDDPGTEKLRTRQVKNFLTVTMLSVGMPMMLMGDEVRRTQGGNNNSMPAGSCETSSTSGGGWP